MSTYRNDTAQSVTVAWCARASHWSTAAHDASDGEPCRTCAVDVAPGELLVFDDAQRNGDDITSRVEADGLDPTE